MTGIRPHLAGQPPGRLYRLEPGRRLDLSRGEVAVCIPVRGAASLVVECLRSVLRHSSPGTTIVLADDASPDPRWAELLEDIDEQGLLALDVYHLRQPARRGFVGNVNAAVEACADADVVVLNSDCIVADGWLDGLQDAAHCGSTVATATPLTNHGTLVSVPHRNHPTGRLPYGWTVDSAAAAVRAASPRLRPRLPSAVGHCVYIRREALDLVGGLDPVFSPGYGEEVDFSLRCSARGLSHVCADDVFVFHRGGGSFDENERRTLQERNDAIVEARYPLYRSSWQVAAEERSSPLAQSLRAARQALVGLRVTIDATCIGPLLMGTQLHVLGLIDTVSALDGVHLRVVVTDECHPDARRVLARLDGVDIITDQQVERGVERSDIVHRPMQVGSLARLARLRRLGDVLVISQLDLLSFRNAAYFANATVWHEYRAATRRALSLAQRVLFSSAHGLAEAVAEGLVDPSVCRIVPPRTDAEYLPPPGPSARPRTTADVDSGGLLLMLGADYQHKNRVFAMRLARELRHLGWDGLLVLAGVHVSDGDSAAEEADLLLRHPDMEARTVILPTISQAEKAWLLERACGVLYPSVDEGFGLVPFEAAAAGVPCFFAPVGALAEVLPDGSATLVPWSVEASARRVAGVLNDAAATGTLVDAVRRTGRHFNRETMAASLEAVYREAVTAPVRAVWEVNPAEVGVSRLGQSLVGAEGGALTPEVQEALWAVSQRRWLRRSVFAGLESVHRGGAALKRLRGGRRSR